jgi:uncharacterized membrane protein
MELLRRWLEVSLSVLKVNADLIAWNLFLAVIPLVLSVWLFRWSKRRSPLWWLVCAVFIAFLPNAPYILTDIIHYVKMMRREIPESVLIFALTPQFFLFLLAGWQCYVMSLLNLGYYLGQRHLEVWVVPLELASHFLAAIGIYLGRFLRWNSWDLVTNPDELASSLARTLSQERPLLAILITFFILTILYWPSKQTNLGLVLRYQEHSAGKPRL